MKIRDRLFEEEAGTPSGGGQGNLFEKGPDGKGGAPSGPDPRVEQLTQTTLSMQQQLAQMQGMLQTQRQAPANTGSPDAVRQVNERMWDALQNNPSELLRSQDAIAATRIQAALQAEREARFPTDVALAMNAVKEEGDNSEVFKRYKPEIEAYISKTWANNPAAFVSPDVWRTAADAIKGRRAKELYGASATADPGAPGKPSTKPMAANKGKDDEPLSEAETYAAEHVFGIDAKDYAKHKRIDKEQRDQRTWSGRAMLQSPLAKMTYKDMNRTVGGFPNPHYGKMRPYMTFDSQVQKPRHARDGE